MLIKISWRNIWRNRQRSLMMILAITVGLWGGIFAASLAKGLMDQRFRTGIEQEYSHIQIHNPDFIKEQNSVYAIEAWPQLEQDLVSNPQIRAFTARTLTNGMVASANFSSGVNILGIDPKSEAQTTSLDKNVIDGSFFEESIRNPVLIGRALANKLKAQVGSRIVITFQDLENELISISCRVSGIFQTANSGYDERNIYLLRSDLAQNLGQDDIINQVAMLVHQIDQADVVVNQYREKYPELTIRTWAEISPQLSFYNELGMTMFMIILIIILMALAFGLLNTMLMSVFERVKELGMLMSIGMNKKRVFLMILYETVFLTFTGGLCGMAVGFVSVKLLRNTGVNLGAVGGDTLSDFGFEAVVYPYIETSFLVWLTVLVILTGIFTSIYPALKALRLRPAEAVRAQ